MDASGEASIFYPSASLHLAGYARKSAWSCGSTRTRSKNPARAAGFWFIRGRGFAMRGEIT